MKWLRKINWIPVVVIILVAVGLVLAFFKIPYGVVVIIAAFPVSILEIARIVDRRMNQHFGPLK